VKKIAVSLQPKTLAAIERGMQMKSDRNKTTVDRDMENLNWDHL
jgi:hypothetical protein